MSTEPRDIMAQAINKHCGGRVVGYAHVDQALAALADAGYAVVKLPERDDKGWPVDPDDDDFHVSRVHLVETGTGRELTGCRVTWGAIELTLSPTHTRALSAALLAAGAGDEK